MKLNEVLDYIGADKATDVEPSRGTAPRTLLEYIAEANKQTTAKKPKGFKYKKKILADSKIQAGIDAYASRGGEISPSVFSPDSNFKSGSMTNTSYGSTEANWSTMMQSVRNDLGFAAGSGITPGISLWLDGGMTIPVEKALQKHLYKLFKDIKYRKKSGDLTSKPTKTSVLRTFGKFDWKALQKVVEKVFTDKDGWRGTVEASLERGLEIAHPLSKLVLEDGTVGPTVAEYLASVFVENTKSRYNGGIAGKDFDHMGLWETLVDIRSGVELYNSNTTNADGKVISSASTPHETAQQSKDAEDSYKAKHDTTIADKVYAGSDDEINDFFNSTLG